MRFLIVLVPLLLAGCAPRALDAPLVTANPALAQFAAELQERLETHDWPAILAVADPDQYETQVRQMGIGEPQYVAELFGLNTVGNTISDHGRIGWSDLERIQQVRITSLTSLNGDHELVGRVTLDDGSERAIRAQIIRPREHFLLTGAVG